MRIKDFFNRCSRPASRSRQTNAPSRLMKSVATQSPDTLPDLQHDDDLFNFTRGRFITDEQHELSKRYVQFNVNELARTALGAIGALSCTSIQKYPDGMHNKCMLLTMSDGRQVVAKIPNPNAGLPHYTTASEVATLDFVARSVLNLPVSKVLKWSSRPGDSPVGSEFIIMENIDGVSLSPVWDDLESEDQWKIIQKIATYQKAMTSIIFQKYGSLYFAQDLAMKENTEALYIGVDKMPVIDPRYSVGPATGRDWVDNARASIEVHRGPWSTLERYHVSIGDRELSATQNLPITQKAPQSLFGPGLYQPTKERKLQAIKIYQDLLHVILPMDRPEAGGYIWHNDLVADNIMVDPQEPAKIVGLIDWQSTEIRPLYFDARKPYFLDHEGPQIHGLERATLPTNFENLREDEQELARTLFMQQTLGSLWFTLTHRINKRLYAAIDFRQTPACKALNLARNLSVDGEAIFLAHVLELEKAWDNLPEAQGRSFPLKFSATERHDIEENLKAATMSIETMQLLREESGDSFPENGLVRHEDYDELCAAFEKVKERIIHQFARNEADREVWERMWPFGR